MNTHLFTASAEDKTRCDVCGKTRNTQAHREAKAQANIEQHQADVAATKAAEVDTDMTEEELDAATAEAEIAEEEKAPAPAKKAVEPNTVRLWVGWRISNACVLRDNTKAQRSLAAKLKAAKPTSELDRYVRLTADELRALDEVGVTFEAQGNTGPVIYSARTMRRRIAAAIDSLENKGNDK